MYTAAHPIDHEVRDTGLEYGKPVVIGAGSVVTKDLSSGVIALGNPCKVLRSITEEDKVYYQNRVME